MSIRLIVVILIYMCVSSPSESLAQAACTRADLQSAVDAYLAAQRSGNPSSLSLAPSAKYIENTTEMPFDKGILKSALKIDFSRSLLDTTICDTFTEVIVTDKSHPYVLGVRIKVAGRRISEAFLHHVREHARTAGAERETNADLPPALSDNVREDTVSAYRCEHECQTCEHTDEFGQQPGPPDRLGENLVHLTQSDDGNGFVHFMDQTFDGSGQRLRPERRSQHHVDRDR